MWNVRIKAYNTNWNIQLYNTSGLTKKKQKNAFKILWFIDKIKLFFHLITHIHQFNLDKILMIPPKIKIILFNCDSNIRLFFIAHCKVIALNLLCFIFGINSLHLFLIAFFKVIDIINMKQSDWNKNFCYYKVGRAIPLKESKKKNSIFLLHYWKNGQMDFVFWGYQ